MKPKLCLRLRVYFQWVYATYNKFGIGVVACRPNPTCDTLNSVGYLAQAKNYFFRSRSKLLAVFCLECLRVVHDDNDIVSGSQFLDLIL